MKKMYLCAMLKIFLQNHSEKIHIPIHESLDASIEQTIDIFENLPQNDGSFLGLISVNGISVQLSKYNKFVWLIEIPVPRKKGMYQIFFTPNKTKKLIEELYQGIDPLKINGLTFEKNK